MKLKRTKRYAPKWNRNREQPKEQQGWIEYIPGHPVEEIERARDVEDQSPLDSARSSIEYVRNHIAAFGGWQDDAGAEPASVDALLAQCDTDLFREFREAISGATKDDEEELKN